MRQQFDDRPRPVFFARAALTLLGMVRAGRGLPWIPAFAVAEDLAAGQLALARALPIEVCLPRPKVRQEDDLEYFLTSLEQR